MEELRAENSCQLDRYDELWKAYDALLRETQKLRSRIIFLNLGGPVEGPRGWPESMNRDPEGPGFRPRGSGNQSRRLANQAGNSGEWCGRPRGCRRAGVVVLGGAR